MKKSEILKIVAFIVIPGGIIAGSIYYGPKIKGWMQDKGWLQDKNKQIGSTDKEIPKE